MPDTHCVKRFIYIITFNQKAWYFDSAFHDESNSFSLLRYNLKTVKRTDLTPANVDKQYPNEDIEHFHPPRKFFFPVNSLLWPPYATTILISTNTVHLSVSHFCIILYHTIFFEIHPYSTCISSFYCWIVSPWINISQLVHLLVNAHVGCFQFGAIMNKAAMNVHILFGKTEFHFSWVYTLEWNCWVIEWDVSLTF